MGVCSNILEMLSVKGRYGNSSLMEPYALIIDGPTVDRSWELRTIIVP